MKSLFKFPTILMTLLLSLQLYAQPDRTGPIGGGEGIARKIIWYAAAPATCSPGTGDVYFNSATAIPYYCSAANTWTAFGLAGAGANTSPSGLTIVYI